MTYAKRPTYTNVFTFDSYGRSDILDQFCKISIQYNVRTVRSFIQLAPCKLYETNLNVCLLLLARGARTCAVRVEF